MASPRKVDASTPNVFVAVFALYEAPQTSGSAPIALVSRAGRPGTSHPATGIAIRRAVTGRPAPIARVSHAFSKLLGRFASAYSYE